jgi:hypothetical protein
VLLRDHGQKTPPRRLLATGADSLKALAQEILAAA